MPAGNVGRPPRPLLQQAGVGVDCNSDFDAGDTSPRQAYGVCSRYGIALRTGEVAVYDRATQRIHCVSCPTAPEPPEIDAGVAGRSARQEYERRAAKREVAIEEHWGNRIGGVVLALSDEPQSTRAWAVGARGEEKLA